MPRPKIKRKGSPKRRSFLEDDIEAQLKKDQVPYEYEPERGKIRYTIPAKDALYTPDFYIKTRTGKTIIIEAKGIWDFNDRFKQSSD